MAPNPIDFLFCTALLAAGGGLLLAISRLLQAQQGGTGGGLAALAGLLRGACALVFLLGTGMLSMAFILFLGPAAGWFLR